jgi:hypothetical protein
LNGELHVDLDEADFLAVFPLAEVGRARLIGTVRDERADRAETLKFEDVSHRAIQHLKLQREYMFRTVSQITLNYRGGPLSKGAAGHVHGGDRLPWVPIDGSDNFEPLAAMTWQVLPPCPSLGSGAASTTFRCISSIGGHYERAGLARNALYLLRPDTYVALADATGAPAASARYFIEHQLRLGATAEKTIEAPPDQSLLVAFRLASL